MFRWVHSQTVLSGIYFSCIFSQINSKTNLVVKKLMLA